MARHKNGRLNGPEALVIGIIDRAYRDYQEDRGHRQSAVAYFASDQYRNHLDWLSRPWQLPREVCEMETFESAIREEMKQSGVDYLQAVRYLAAAKPHLVPNARPITDQAGRLVNYTACIKKDQYEIEQRKASLVHNVNRAIAAYAAERKMGYFDAAREYLADKPEVAAMVI